MNKEIGGFFGIEKTINLKNLSENDLNLNYARNCLAYLIKAKNIKKIYLPVYLCQSIRKKCEEIGVEVKYYHINKSFEIELDNIKTDSYVYIVNYYGLIDECKIIEYKNKFKNIIVDNAQAFFNKPIENVDTIYSYRKFFGVPDGACLITDCKDLNDNNFENERICDEVFYMIGRDEETASCYYKDFTKRSELLTNKEIKYISNFSKNILNSVDFVSVKKIREENFKFLHKNLKGINKFKIDKCLYYMYPLLLDATKANLIRKILIENKVYIPKLWPNILNMNDEEWNLVNNVLPIPIDQRYGIDDMEVIIKVITNV